MTDTNQLLHQYAHHGSEPAFRELVNNYLDLVYSTALRRASGNAAQAEDITQTVFTDLSRKACSLPDKIMLGGWLHRHTCFVASTHLRSELRRQNREREAMQMNTLHSPPDDTWAQLGPVLDEAIDQLEAADREAILLRYFEHRDLRAVGVALGIGEDAAQKRVSRAVDKLRELVGQRGSALSATVLAAALLSGAVSAAPIHLGSRISSTALAAAGAGAAGGILAFLAAAKLKLALAAVVLVAALTAPVWLKHPRATDSIAPNVAATELVQAAAVTPPANAASALLTNTGAAVAAMPKPKESGLLRLKIVAADSGKVIPVVSIDYRRWDGDKFIGRKLQSTRLGECEVSFARESLTELELTTRVEGFADTRLRWRTDRGDSVPEEYTLRLDRGAFIGGSVVDADGNPVAGAKVGFNHEDDPSAAKWPEDHECGWIEVSTDETGHWQMQRMADEVVRRIYGSAKHAGHVGSAYIFLSRDRSPEADLRAGKYVFHLGRAISATGVVMDESGTPVAGAEVLVGGRSESGSRKAKSEADGTFTVKGCAGGKQMVTASAKGFSTTTIEVADLGSDPIKLVLQHGQLLRLRLVNQQGQPIPKAYVWLDTFRNGQINESRPVPVQADFSPRSDKQGLVIWSNAPDTELQFDIAATGYMRTNEFKIHPDGKEHTIVMSPALLVSGKVTEATTGKAIPKFRVVFGWPSIGFGGNEVIHWSSFARDWLNFKDGAYKHGFEDALVHGCPNPGYALKFEADGYAASISRVIKADEGEVQLDVALKPAVTQQYTVLLPDGKPAVNAEVGLISPGVRLELAPGGFNREHMESGGSLLMTDKDGRFQLSADDAVHSVVIAHPRGFLRLSRGELAGQEYLQLQPWGRLEGAVTSGGKPAAGREFTVEFDSIQSSDLWFGYTAFRVKADAEGKFTFNQIPPGRLKLLRVIPFQISAGSGGWSTKFEQTVEIQPGETTQVTLGGTGYTITARVRWPAGFDASNAQQVMGQLHTPVPAWMSEMMRDPQRASTMMQQPEVQAFTKTAKQFQMSLANSVLSAEEVPAGEFEVSVFAILKNGKSSTNMSALSGAVRVNVPATPANGVLDVGEVSLNANPANSR